MFCWLFTFDYKAVTDVRLELPKLVYACNNNIDEAFPIITMLLFLVLSLTFPWGGVSSQVNLKAKQHISTQGE